MEEELIYSKGITRFPSLTSTPGLTASLPDPDLRRQSCSDSSGRTLLIEEASQILMSLRSALLTSGALVRLRESRCDDLSGEFFPGEGVESR